MQTIVSAYAVYMVLSICLTVWVGRTLFKSGRIFLVDVFHGNEEVADAVNHLLVVGFYLINLGYVSLMLKISTPVEGAQQGIEALSGKMGLVLLVLGAMHFFNMAALARCRRMAKEENLQRSVAKAYGH